MFRNLVITAIFIFTTACNSQSVLNKEITSKEISTHIEYLASDEMSGRFSGSKEIKVAANYLMQEFQSYGLKPLFTSNQYFQEFEFITDISMTSENEITLNIKGKKIPIKLHDGFTPAPFARESYAQSDLVFVGYGISAPKLSYDDYEGVDVKDKIVIALRYTPEYDNPHSQFDEFASLRYKASLAKEKGAKGIIFVNGYLPKDEDDKLVEFKYDRAAGVKDFPAVHMKRIYAEELLSAYGLTLVQYQDSIINSKKPFSFALTNSSAEINCVVKEVSATCQNVGALLEGTDTNLKNEYIVIGAHYDHLGMGGHGSLYRGNDLQIHNGADDNASGTTGMLELAEYFALSKNNKRSIIFLAFSGEELGLLGSNFFVNYSPVPLEKIVTMINLDMIGRMNEKNELIVYGTGTSPKWKDILNAKNENNFVLTFNDEGYGPSDHSSFYGKAIPVLFFFTGTHSDYHRPSDDADKINSSSMQNLLNFVSSVANEIVNGEVRPEYVNVPRKEGARTGGWKVYVGTIPDYAYSGEGLKITGVNEGSPAQKAGLQGGDIIIHFGKKKVTNIYDYVYALQELAPGDVVDVKVKRGDNEVNLNLTLGAK